MEQIIFAKEMNNNNNLDKNWVFCAKPIKYFCADILNIDIRLIQAYWLKISSFELYQLKIKIKLNQSFLTDNFNGLPFLIIDQYVLVIIIIIIK